MNREERIERLRVGLDDELLEMAKQRASDRKLPPILAKPVLDGVLEGARARAVPLESASAVGALEAIVKRVGRPPLLVRGGQIELEPLPSNFPPNVDALLRGTEKWLPSVGRIDFINHALQWGGTGWVVEALGRKNMVITNRHVAKMVARRKADGHAIFIRSPNGALCGARIDFAAEVGSLQDDSHVAELVAVDYLADDLSADVALLRLATDGIALPSPLELADKEARRDALVALIGYPAYDSRNDAGDQARYFHDLYEVKRVAPGFVTQAAGDTTYLRYDCTSLGGNSGSPIFDLDAGKVVGLHFSGVYGEYNAGIGVTTINALRTTGQVTVADRLSARGDEDEAASDGRHEAAFFAGRKGFDTQFLGDRAMTSWPTLPRELADGLAMPSDGPEEPGELRYTHFGVKYSATRKLPLMTAVNIDGQAAVRIKRTADKWFADGRIPWDVQLGKSNFADPQIDRGHMVRREDPNWDPEGNEARASVANFDTFHYVNACAQHSLLNQGKQLWQGLENYILDSSRTHGFKACVFTGPILRAPDSTEDELVIDGAIAPLEFWKLVATLDGDGTALHATAYILSQGQLLRDLMQRRSRREAVEGFELGAYRTFQVAIADLQQATGYGFDAYLAADPLARDEAGAEAIAREEPLFLPLDDLSTIRL